MTAKLFYNLLLSIPNKDTFTKDEIRKLYQTYLKILEKRNNSKKVIINNENNDDNDNDNEIDKLISNINNLSINEDFEKKNVENIKQMQNEILNNEKPIKINVFQLLDTNNYINEKSGPNESIHSFSYLATRKDLGQSQKISLGICMERLLSDMISTCKDWKNIRPKNEKGKKEKDSLWLNEKLKKIVYAEYKANLELDTEKSKETDKKCKNIGLELKNIYSDYNLTCIIVGLRYLSNKEKLIEPILKKYTDTPIYGINDYLELFNLEKIDGYDGYKKIIDGIIDRKF
jgi:transcriptional regulator of met regulon